jgi:hypothetical protein
VSPVMYKLGFYNSKGDILHSHRRGNLKSYKVCLDLCMTYIWKGNSWLEVDFTNAIMHLMVAESVSA